MNQRIIPDIEFSRPNVKLARSAIRSLLNQSLAGAVILRNFYSSTEIDTLTKVDREGRQRNRTPTPSVELFKDALNRRHKVVITRNVLINGGVDTIHTDGMLEQDHHTTFRIHANIGKYYQSDPIMARSDKVMDRLPNLNTNHILLNSATGRIFEQELAWFVSEPLKIGDATLFVSTAAGMPNFKTFHFWQDPQGLQEHEKLHCRIRRQFLLQNIIIDR